MSATDRPVRAHLVEGGTAMSATSLLDAAFAHHVWATIQLVDACEPLSPDQLAHTVPGTRGAIIDTLVHLIESDTFDLAIVDRGDLADVEDVGPDFQALRHRMRRNGVGWSAFLAGLPDPDEPVPEVDPADGFRRIATVGMRMAATLDHGTDHRSQICTALTTLEIQPPQIGVMQYGVQIGTVEETQPA
jgi:uncharacterized damage-inducible protein DinB